MLELTGLLLLGMGGSLIGLVGLLRPRLLETKAMTIAPWILAATASGVALMSSVPATALLPLALPLVWLLFNGRKVVEALTRAHAAVQQPIFAGVLVLGMSPALAWAWTILNEPEHLVPEPTLPEILCRAVTSNPFRTDTGRELRMYAPAVALTQEEENRLAAYTPVSNVICTAPPGPQYNCHGWVFTDGRYWVNSAEVEVILEDNAYYPVSHPRAGDLIVYRNGGSIVHTGIVRVADERGVLVESKWDRRGRYIHAPENQIYAVDFEYYRTDRPGHRLRTLEELPSMPPGVGEPVSNEP